MEELRIENGISPGNGNAGTKKCVKKLFFVQNIFENYNFLYQNDKYLVFSVLIFILKDQKGRKKKKKEKNNFLE